VLFANAYSNATFTFPSTASLFTSTQPEVHRITYDAERQDRLKRLSDAYVLVTEVAHDHGYRTALVTFEGWLSPTANYLQGVDVWVEGSRADDDLAAGARAFISESTGQPFFLYLHFVDMHDYFFPEHLFAGLEPGGGGLSPALWSLAGREPMEAYAYLVDELSRPGALSAADLAHLVAVYDRRLAHTDRAIASVVDHLARLGLTDSTIVAVTADHGEQFLEHGTLVHGGSAFYNELIHVPLVVANPVLFPAAVRASTPATSIDLAPTLLDLVGIAAPPEFQGESLVGRWDEDRVVIAQNEKTRKAISRRFSYIVGFTPPREELYDLAADPGETANLVSDRPQVVARLRATLRAGLEAAKLHPYQAVMVDDIAMPAELRSALESLGYLE
jgi:arylsulfatase A-like enzyme